MLTEIPSSLKQLARLVVRGFYDIEYSLIVDMLVRYPCMREDDLCDLLKFDKKVLRGKLATLKADKFCMVKLKIETGEDGKACKVNCWFINYKIFVNIVKYKLDHMRKRMETEERDATSRSSFRCSNCDKQFTDLEADQLFDFATQEFKCTYCGAAVEEDEAAMPKKDSRLLLAKFNDQMEKLYELLRIVEDIRLAPELLEPDPVDFVNNAAGVRKSAAGPASGDVNDGRWTNSGAGGFKEEAQTVEINFGEEQESQQQKKELPSWITESTVADRAAEAVSSMGPGPALTADTEPEAAPDDEITNILLQNERINKEKGLGLVIPGDDSDSDNRSDDSDDAPDTVDRDAAILAAAYDRDDDEDGVEMMEEDSDSGQDIPTIRVGGEEFDITDVTQDVINRMTQEEIEKYNQLYQDFYKDM